MRLAWRVFGTFYLLLSSCTYSDDPDRRLAVAEDTYVLQSSSPPAGSLEVDRAAPIDLYFNVPPEANSVVSARVHLYSGTIETRGWLSTDLLEQRIRFTPTEVLRSSLRYDMSLGADLRGANGARLEHDVVFNFTTGSSAAYAKPAPPAAVRAAALQTIWDQHCTSCHAAQHAAAGIDLSTSSGAVRSLVNVPSAMSDHLRVIPLYHARSYLMLKLIGTSDTIGNPMPPDNPALSLSELRQIATWIDGGALP